MKDDERPEPTHEEVTEALRRLLEGMRSRTDFLAALGGDDAAYWRTFARLREYRAWENFSAFIDETATETLARLREYRKSAEPGEGA